MAMTRCPDCGKEISDSAKSCPNCGHSFEELKFCKYCGEKIPKDSVVCPKCGRQVEVVSQQNGGITINNAATSSAAATANAKQEEIERKRKEINKTTALLLCIFLGWFGGHKFYEGKTGMGILYIFTFGLFGIGWIIDLITIAMKPNPYYV